MSDEEWDLCKKLGHDWLPEGDFWECDRCGQIEDDEE